MISIKKQLQPFAFLGSLIVSPALIAAPTDSTLALLGSEDLYIEELPVIISATRLEQPLNESPVATTVIDRQMIDASGAQTIADLLRLVPGFTVGYLNGNYPVATYHGQSDRYSKRIQLLIDGRSVYLPTLSGVSWSDLVITIDEIDRIEVIRGPNASTYGNNAFQAVISIITRHAAQDQGHYAKFTAGSHDTADGIYRFGGNNDDLDYRLSIGTKNNSGTSLLDDDTATNYLSYRLDYQLNTSTSMFYQGGIQDSSYGDVMENAQDKPNDVDITTAFQHIKLEHSFDDDSSFSVQYYYNYTKSFNAEDPETISLSQLSAGTPLEPLLANIDDFEINEIIDLQSERHDLELSYYYNPTESLRLVSGTSVRADKVTAKDVFDPEASNVLFLYRLYTHGEYSITSDWLINAGLMIEKNEISGTDIAPRLAIIHHLNPQHTFRLSASRATRTPTLFDENGYVFQEKQLTQNGGQPLNNPPLQAILGGDVIRDVYVYSSGGVKSEEITSIELGWMAQLLDNQLVIDMKAFADESRDLIFGVDYPGSVPTENVDNLMPTSGAVGADDFANAASSSLRGIEITSDYRFGRNWRLYAFMAYIEIDAKDTYPNADDSASGRLKESVPRRSFGAMLMKQWSHNLNTSLAAYHVSNMDWMDRTHNRKFPKGNEFDDRSAEAYYRLDFVLRKSVKLNDGQIDYSLILQNLLGSYFDYTRTKYTDPSEQTVNIPGSLQDPRAYFELAFRFN